MSELDKAKTRKSKALTKMLPEVIEITGYTEASFHAQLGGKNVELLNIKDTVIASEEEFVTLWMQGMMKYLDELGERKESTNAYRLMQFLRNHDVVREYAFTFLERMYLRNYNALSKKRPKDDEAVMWIGQENASYGILITSVFRGDNWENDKSEIRHFGKPYWTIGHILETGLVIPYKEEVIKFNSVEEYLSFFKNVIVRNSGSIYEMGIAEKYCEFVLESENPELVPLLIPEFRYDGIQKQHKYRLDFTIIDPYTLQKYGFELSPWSTHGKLTGIRGKTQVQVNAEALANFEKEMTKHKDYFKRYEIFILIYTDSDLQNIDNVFDDMKQFLNPTEAQKQLKLHVLNEFLNYK